MHTVQMRPVATDVTQCAVCLCWSVQKMAEVIEMLLEGGGRIMGPRNHVLDGVKIGMRGDNGHVAFCQITLDACLS